MEFIEPSSLQLSTASTDAATGGAGIGAVATQEPSLGGTVTESNVQGGGISVADELAAVSISESATLVSCSSASTRAKLVAEPVALPDVRFGSATKFAVVIRNAFSKEECASLITSTETKGYITALLNVGNGREVLDQVSAVEVRLLGGAQLFFGRADDGRLFVVLSCSSLTK